MRKRDYSFRTMYITECTFSVLLVRFSPTSECVRTFPFYCNFYVSRPREPEISNTPPYHIQTYFPGFGTLWWIYMKYALRWCTILSAYASSTSTRPSHQGPKGLFSFTSSHKFRIQRIIFQFIMIIPCGTREREEKRRTGSKGGNTLEKY